MTQTLNCSFPPRHKNAHMTPTQIEWMSKEEAAVRLGSPERPLSPRRVLDHWAKDGRPQSSRARDPQTGQTVVRIHAGSVERFLTEKAAPAVMLRAEGGRTARIADPAGPARARASSARRVRGSRPRSPHTYGLTLQEAVDYSGLPAATLGSRRMAGGRLRALDVGRGRRGGRWRVRKVDLRDMDAFSLEPRNGLLPPGAAAVGADGMPRASRPLPSSRLRLAWRAAATIA